MHSRVAQNGRAWIQGVELARRIDDKVAEATLLRQARSRPEGWTFRDVCSWQTARVKMDLQRLEDK